MKFSLEGKIDDSGRIVINRDDLNTFIHQNKNSSIYLTVAILSDADKYRKTYFHLVNEFSKLTGYNPGESHVIFKSEILKQPTTKDLTLVQWEEFIENCKIYIYDVFDIMT